MSRWSPPGQARIGDLFRLCGLALHDVDVVADLDQVEVPALVADVMADQGSGAGETYGRDHKGAGSGDKQVLDHDFLPV